MSSSPRKRPASEAIVAGGVVVLLIAIVAIVFLSGAGRALYPPKPATEQAVDTSNLYNIVFAIAVAIFVAVEGLIVWSILRYRRRPGDVDLPPQTHGNNFVEVLWTLIPTVIVLYLFAISWDTLNKVDAVSTDPEVRIQAIAGQFQWQFEYLDANGNSQQIFADARGRLCLSRSRIRNDADGQRRKNGVTPIHFPPYNLRNVLADCAGQPCCIIITSPTHFFGPSISDIQT